MVYGAPPKIWERYNDDNYCWITGEELTKIVREQDVQWVWRLLEKSCFHSAPTGNR